MVRQDSLKTRETKSCVWMVVMENPYQQKDDE